MFTIAFATAVAERAVRAAAASALLVVGADQVDALTLSWQTVGGFAAGGAVLSVLGSLAAAPIGAKGSPAITRDPAPPESGGIRR